VSDVDASALGALSGRARWAWWAAALLALTVGTALRLIGSSSLEFWADEAWWASKIIEGNPGWIRPPGYTFLTQVIASVTSTEFSLRGPSVVAALLELPLLLWLLLRFTRPFVAVAALYVLALHPAAINFAKEFKPYALEALLHTALIAAATHYVARSSRRALLALVLTSIAAAPLSWSTVFLYPGVYLAVLVAAGRNRAWRDVAVAVVGAAVTLAVLGAVFYARLRTSNPHPEYWGDKYGVFYLGDSWLAHAQWLVLRTGELVSLPLQLRFAFGHLPAIDPISVVLSVVGVAGTLQAARRGAPTRALTLVLPWLLFVLFNLVGAWPYGVFRTNHFALIYAILWCALGADALWTWWAPLRTRIPAFGPVVVAVVVLGLALAFPLNWERASRKARASRASVLRAVHLIQAVHPSALRMPIYFDGQGCSVMSYYRDHHDIMHAPVSLWFDDHALVRCSQGRDPGYRKMMAEVVDVDDGPYFVVNAKRSTTDHTAKLLPAHCARSARTRLLGTTVFWCGRDGDAVPVGFEDLAAR
jgi:hypothetical protein